MTEVKLAMAEVNPALQKSRAEGILSSMPSLMEAVLGVPCDTDLDKMYSDQLSLVKSVDIMRQFGASVGSEQNDLSTIDEIYSELWSKFKKVTALRAIRNSAQGVINPNPGLEVPKT